MVIRTHKYANVGNGRSLRGAAGGGPTEHVDPASGAITGREPWPLKDGGFPGKLGSGARFAAFKAKVAQNPKVRNPGAVVAAEGRAKYGKKRFAKLAAAGRKAK